MYHAPYEILGVRQSASLEEIHSAFRRKARLHHPDLGGDKQKFLELTTAYEELVQRFEAEQPVDVTSPDSRAEFEARQQDLRQAFENPGPGRGKRGQGNSDSRSSNGFTASDLKFLMTGKLPLQDQTTYFILVNALDIFLTWLVLWRGGYEANPIADFFIQRWGNVGMIAFKLCVVATVCVIAQLVALRSIRKATWLLNLGTAIIGCVVLYSVWLLAKH